MNSFPADIKLEISKRVLELKNIKKEEWKAKKRDTIFTGLIKASASNNAVGGTYSYRFEAGYYLLNTEICEELVTDFDVRIYMRKINSQAQKSDKDEELLYDDWVYARNYDFLDGEGDDHYNLSHTYDMYCTVKL